MSKWPAIAAMITGTMALVAQETPIIGVSGTGASGTGANGRPTLPRTAARSYAESVSRDLFAGCDADGDDRLDLFEACDALDSLEDPKNSAAFLRLDQDRDGFLSWPEFDQHFWSVVQVGGTFHVRPSRQLTQGSPERMEARRATPLQRFLHMHDANGNGALEPDEVDQMVQHTELPPDIAGRLRTLDHDRSGRIEEAELAPWFELLRGHVPEARTVPTPRGGALLPPWHENDVDGNGKIDQQELSAILRRLDPALVRWTEALLRKLDRNKDGVLDGDELPTTKRPVRPQPSTAATHAPVPRLAATPTAALVHPIGPAAK